MKNFNYTKKEMNVFKKALKTVLEDLESLWDLKTFDELEFDVELPGISSCEDHYTEEGWSFVMEEYGFYLINRQCDQIINFATRNKLGQLQYHLKIHSRDIIFLREYDKIREKVVSRIEKIQSAKQENIDMAKNLIGKYSKNAVVEITLPNTNNQQTIEVVEENGKKIGTLNFGDMAIKIISSAYIDFQTKTDSKTKRKQ